MTTDNFTIESCPFCSKHHDSRDHDENWYFSCCGHARLVWLRDEAGVLSLEIAPDDLADQPT